MLPVNSIHLCYIGEISETDISKLIHLNHQIPLEIGMNTFKYIILYNILDIIYMIHL